jgi:HSP20 family protein
MAKNNDNLNLKYVKKIVSEVMGEDLWNGFYDVVSADRPRIDMYDDNNTLIVLAEIPSILSYADANISISANKLIIKCSSKDKYQHSKPGNRLKSECIYGTYDRIVELPYVVDQNDIDAVYENGMLEIRMHRCEQTDGNTVRVEFKK